jgi:hypothetical protein
MSNFIYNNAKEIMISVIFLISWITSWCFGYRFAAKKYYGEGHKDGYGDRK